MPKIKIGNQISGILDFSNSCFKFYMYQISLSYKEIVNKYFDKDSNYNQNHNQNYDQNHDSNLIKVSYHESVIYNTVSTDFCLGTKTSSPCSFHSNLISVEWVLLLNIFYVSSNLSNSQNKSNNDSIPFVCPYSAVEISLPNLNFGNYDNNYNNLDVVSCNIPVIITPF